MRLTRLWSEPESFAPMVFVEGLNIILAHLTRKDRTSGTASRNGAGKTTFARVLEFCLLYPFSPQSVLAATEFKRYTFFLEFEHEGHKYVIGRSPQNPGAVRLSVDGVLSRVGSVTELRSLLSGRLLGLSEEYTGLSWQIIMSYLMRNEQVGYADAFRPVALLNRPTWVAANMFFLGLDPELPFAESHLRKEQKSAETIRQGLVAHLESKGHGQLMQLRLEMSKLDRELAEREGALAAFGVGREYEHLSGEAAELSLHLKRLGSENFLDRKRMAEYRDLMEKAGTAAADVQAAVSVYEDLRLHFPDLLRKGLQDVVDFQAAVVRNRREFLRGEVIRLEGQVAERTQEIGKLDQQRAAMLQVLKAGNPLEEIARLNQAQNMVRERRTELASYAAMHDDITAHERRITGYEREIARVRQETQEHLRKSEQRLQEVAGAFSNLYATLYGRSLQLRLKYKGRFDIGIKGQGKELESAGRYRSAVFCYDLALLLANRDRHPFPHWVLHDGVFAGVDSEQAAMALTIASELPPGLQYICTVNSDNLPPRTDFSKYVRREISDSAPEKTFMRFRF